MGRIRFCLAVLDFILPAHLEELGVSPHLLWCIVNYNHVRNTNIGYKMMEGGAGKRLTGHRVYVDKEAVGCDLGTFGSCQQADL